MKNWLPVVTVMFLIGGLLFCACKPAAVDTVSPATPQTGGSLKWAISYEPDTLDPHKTRSEYANYVMSLLGSALVAIAPDGSIMPYAAESWAVSDDGLVWDFQLRTDMMFYYREGVIDEHGVAGGDIVTGSDPITAVDYAWTYTRAIGQAVHSPAAGLLDKLVKAEVVDDFTLRLTLSEPRPDLLYSLSAAGYLQPLPRQMMEETGEEAFGLKPAGSGPFWMKYWIGGNRIILARNPDFTWGPDLGQGTGPYTVDFIEFRVIKDYATQMEQLEQGVIDLAYVEAQDLAQFEDVSRFSLYTQPLPGLQPYIALNLQQPPFTDVNIRKALNLALDRQALIDQTRSGSALIQNGPLSESTFGYWDGVTGLGTGYDPDQAAELMRAAGYERGDADGWSRDGEPLTLLFLTADVDQPTSQLTQTIAEQYRAFGLDIELRTVDVADFSELLRVGDYQMALTGWSHPDADLLYWLFHSSNIDESTPGPSNIQRLSDPDLDALLEQIHAGADPAAAQEASRQAQQYLVENAVLVPLYTPVEYLVLNAKVEDEQYSTLSGFDFSGAKITDSSSQ